MGAVIDQDSAVVCSVGESTHTPVLTLAPCLVESEREGRVRINLGAVLVWKKKVFGFLEASGWFIEAFRINIYDLSSWEQLCGCICFS